MIVGEELLWQAVIMRALQDAVWVDTGAKLKGRNNYVAFCGMATQTAKANRMRDEAAFWLLFDKRDFVFVCEAAGLSPNQVREGARMILGADDEQRAAWSANGFSLSSVWSLRESRGRGVAPEGDRG